MVELQKRRMDAWKSLVGEVKVRATVRELAAFVRARPGLWRRADEARSASTAARRTLLELRQTVSEGSHSPEKEAMVRAWADCMDEIMSLADALSARLVDEPSPESASARAA